MSDAKLEAIREAKVRMGLDELFGKKIEVTTPTPAPPTEVVIMKKKRGPRPVKNKGETS